MRDRDIHPPRYVWRAVVALRKRGRAVHQHERRDRHVVDGEIVPTSWLLDQAEMAKAEAMRAPHQVEAAQ